MNKHSVLARLGNYVKLARAVKAKQGLGMLRQFAEIAALRKELGRIGPGDYYTYCLHETVIPPEEKRRFVGWRAESRVDTLLNDPRWHCLGLDKVLMYSVLSNNGITIPETKAIYLPGRMRTLRGAVSLTSETDLHAWLRHPGNYPFFSKPSASGFGRGAFLASCYSSADDAVLMKDATRIPVLKFASGFDDIEQLGYLFQTPLQQHVALLDSLGTTPSSLRFMVLYDEVEGPLIHRVFWKIPTGSNASDNFNSGLTGNLAAGIDLDSGSVIRVINGIGSDLHEVERHPDTGFRFSELEVPDWPAVKRLVLDVALTLPKLHFQQWDIALASQGPTVLEVNLFATGGCELTQILYRKGLLDDNLMRFLARHPTNKTR
jgi:hypothetical protein